MNVASFLENQKVEFTVVPHKDTFEAHRMAQRLHVSGRAVAKTVMLRVNTNEYVVAVLPANKEIDFSKAADFLSCEIVELASEQEMAECCRDCEFGVLPPFGSQYGLGTILDERLCDQEEIYFEGNNHHEAIRMNLEDFCRIEQPQIGDFAWD